MQVIVTVDRDLLEELSTEGCGGSRSRRRFVPPPRSRPEAQTALRASGGEGVGRGNSGSRREQALRSPSMLLLRWVDRLPADPSAGPPRADDGTKDLEILVLRQQLRVLRRKTGRPGSSQATGSCSPPAGCSPTAVGIVARHAQTLLRWHRTLVRRKWTYGKKRTPGRPPIDPQTAAP